MFNLRSILQREGSFRLIVVIFLGDMFQDPEWMPGTVDSTEPYIFHVFPKHTLSMILFNV